MSLSEIYKLYGLLVYNLALQYTQNVQDAEEVTQDVFLQVHEKLNTFKAESQLKTWIYRITINKSLDFLRARKSKKRWSFFSKNRVDEGEFRIADSKMNHPGIRLEQKEAVESLFACINDLPDNQRTAIILIKIDGLDMNEVAQIMSLSYKALESLLQRAKKNLKKILNENEGI